MAQVSMVTVVCDLCGSPTDRTRYEVRGMERRVTLDLCTGCALPIDTMLKHKKAVGISPRPRGVPDVRRATMDEIEAMKRKKPNA